MEEQLSILYNKAYKEKNNELVKDIKWLKLKNKKVNRKLEDKYQKYSSLEKVINSI